MIQYLMLLPLLISVISGLIIGIRSTLNRHTVTLWAMAAMGVNLLIIAVVFLQPGSQMVLPLYKMTEELLILFSADTAGKFFALLAAFVWLMAGMASVEYLEHDKDYRRFFCFYLLTEGILLTLCFTGNLFTFYIFFEMMSLLSMPLVLHELTQEAIAAAMKYLFYSMGGAFLALFGFFLFSSRGYALVFTPGGCLAGMPLDQTSSLAILFMILGYGVKAGMFPAHGWLPTAHPVAPAPASAVLSGVITKAGVLGILRTVYYIVGPRLLAGTWVQKVWITLTLITIFMGSMMAYREQVLKKRMAYSTVSQVSYVLFGLSLLHPVAFTGALLHVIFHSLVKDTLFLSAGAIIHQTGRTRVKELAGIGKGMPLTLWCFTLVSVTLVGIPPTSAFISKWYLAIGSLESGIPVIGWLGPVILLLSALLTAGYLLTISIQAFLPGTPDEISLENEKASDPGWLMTLPMLLMTILAVLFGIWPTPLLHILEELVSVLF